VKNTHYQPQRLTNEQNGAKTITTRRRVEAWGASYHCKACHQTRVLLNSKAPAVYHHCKGFQGMIETSLTLIYGVPR
jgi:hypothetical protein